MANVTSATLSNADVTAEDGAWAPAPIFVTDQRRATSPPLWKTGDVALWCERSAGGGQRFSTVMVEERAAGETTPGPADAGALSVTDGASTFAVDARDLRALEIPAALVPRLLSNARASPSRSPSPHPSTGTKGPWGWLSPAGLTTAEEDVFPVAAHAVRHLVGKGGHYRPVN